MYKRQEEDFIVGDIAESGAQQTGVGAGLLARQYQVAFPGTTALSFNAGYGCQGDVYKRQVWHKLREQIADVPVRKRRFFTRYRVVACLLLLIGVGTLLVYNRYSRLQPSDLLVQSIHPGSSKAVLITSEKRSLPSE